MMWQVTDSKKCTKFVSELFTDNKEFISLWCNNSPLRLFTVVFKLKESSSISTDYQCVATVYIHLEWLGLHYSMIGAKLESEALLRAVHHLKPTAEKVNVSDGEGVLEHTVREGMVVASCLMSNTVELNLVQDKY